jgi:hypothetical protein
MLQEEQGADLVPLVALIDEDGAALEQVAMLFDHQVERRIEQRLAWADEGRGRFAGDADQLLLKRDPLIALEHRQPAADLAVASAHQGRDVLDLVTPRLPLVDRAPEPAERLEEERRDEVRLEPARQGALHVLPDLPDPGDVHRVVAQCRTSSSSQRCSRSSAVSTFWNSRALTSGWSP